MQETTVNTVTAPGVEPSTVLTVSVVMADNLIDGVREKFPGEDLQPDF